MKRYMLTEQSFIAGSLLAAGSIVTEADLAGAEPGSALTEVDAKGQPKDKAVTGISAAPIQVAPVAPHAPNPTAPQGLPPHNIGEVEPAGNYVGAEGVESNEAAAARATQAKAKK